MASTLLERDIYDVHVIHNPNAKGRAPRYKVIKGDVITKPLGATTILGKVIAKDFVGWALDCMGDVLAEKIPVITQEDIDEAKLESSRRRDQGGSTGSEAHKLVEDFLKGEETIKGVTPSQEVRNAFNAFKSWFSKTKPTVINVEEVIYSQEYGFAGCYDAMMEIDGKVYLTDLKTTNTSRKAPEGVYAEYFIQLGFYALAHEEQRKYEEANGGTKLKPVEGLLVISCRKDGKTTIISNEDIGLTLEDCVGMAKRVVNLYHFLEYTTKALGGK